MINIMKSMFLLIHFYCAVNLLLNKEIILLTVQSVIFLPKANVSSNIKKT